APHDGRAALRAGRMIDHRRVSGDLSRRRNRTPVLARPRQESSAPDATNIIIPIGVTLLVALRARQLESVHTVRKATVGGIRDARTAGNRPASAPMRMAAAMPPAHASTGITMAQLLELAYTAVAAV